jgi:hypothetical protein
MVRQRQIASVNIRPTDIYGCRLSENATHRWPRLLNRALAAEYCGVGIDTFNANVDRDALPRPLQLPTGSLMWDRLELDAAIDLLKTGRRSVEESIGNVREEYETFKRERRRGAAKGRSPGRLARP